MNLHDTLPLLAPPAPFHPLPSVDGLLPNGCALGAIAPGNISMTPIPSLSVPVQSFGTMLRHLSC